VRLEPIRIDDQSLITTTLELALVKQERDALRAEVEKLRRVAEAVRPLLSAVVRLVRDWPFPSRLVQGMSEEHARDFAKHGNALTDGYAKVCDALGAIESKPQQEPVHLPPGATTLDRLVARYGESERPFLSLLKLEELDGK
jgi:hypothetical protein